MPGSLFFSDVMRRGERFRPARPVDDQRVSGWGHPTLFLPRNWTTGAAGFAIRGRQATGEVAGVQGKGRPMARSLRRCEAACFDVVHQGHSPGSGQPPAKAETTEENEPAEETT